METKNHKARVAVLTVLSSLLFIVALLVIVETLASRNPPTFAKSIQELDQEVPGYLILRNSLFIEERWVQVMDMKGEVLIEGDYAMSEIPNPEVGPNYPVAIYNTEKIYELSTDGLDDTKFQSDSIDVLASVIIPDTDYVVVLGMDENGENVTTSSSVTVEGGKSIKHNVYLFDRKDRSLTELIAPGVREYEYTEAELKRVAEGNLYSQISVLANKRVQKACNCFYLEDLLVGVPSEAHDDDQRERIFRYDLSNNVLTDVSENPGELYKPVELFHLDIYVHGTLENQPFSLVEADISEGIGIAEFLKLSIQTPLFMFEDTMEGIFSREVEYIYGSKVITADTFMPGSDGVIGVTDEDTKVHEIYITNPMIGQERLVVVDTDGNERVVTSWFTTFRRHSYKMAYINEQYLALLIDDTLGVVDLENGDMYRIDTIEKINAENWRQVPGTDAILLSIWK